MRASWAPKLGAGRLSRGGGLLALLLALSACGGDSALRLVTAPSAPPTEASAPAARPAAASTSASARGAAATIPASSSADKPAIANTAAAPDKAGSAGPGQATTAAKAGSAAPGQDTTAAMAGGAPSAAASPPAQGPVTVPPAGGRALPSGARLQIPSIGVDAPMITLGVNPDGMMQVPNNGNDVGWYTFSAAPGTPGNAVLSGHLDTATSPVAVFTRLKDLKQGDALDIVEDGKKIDYSVFWTKAWPDDTAPLALILGNAPSPTLTLITCSGTFNRISRNYSDRLVVRAKLPGSIL